VCEWGTHQCTAEAGKNHEKGQTLPKLKALAEIDIMETISTV